MLLNWPSGNMKN